MRRPVFIAQQARNAKGILGWIIASLMAHETWAQNRRAIDALGVARGDHVLDIGCGPGRSLATLANLAPEGRVVGADPSSLMAELAVRRNSTLVRARRVEIVMASATSLPFADAAFDKALCVHVLYFWNDLDRAFAEIARVLKPGGKLAPFQDKRRRESRASLPGRGLSLSLADRGNCAARSGWLGR